MMSIKIKILGAFSFAREQDRRVVSNGVAIMVLTIERTELITMSEIERKILKRFMYTTVPFVVLKLMVLMEEHKAKRKKV